MVFFFKKSFFFFFTSDTKDITNFTIGLQIEMLLIIKKKSNLNLH